VPVRAVHTLPLSFLAYELAQVQYYLSYLYFADPNVPSRFRFHDGAYVGCSNGFWPSVSTSFVLRLSLLIWFSSFGSHSILIFYFM
jgi:hypothetical protein